MRRPSWFILVLLAVGGLLVYGGFSVYADQSSGTPGTARVSGCEGGTRYQPAVRCRGSWTIGGSLVDGGRVATGRIEGADHDDIGSTIDVRIHGDDHATKPSLGTPIMLWALGGGVVLLSLAVATGGRRTTDRASPS